MAPTSSVPRRYGVDNEAPSAVCVTASSGAATAAQWRLVLRAASEAFDEAIIVSPDAEELRAAVGPEALDGMHVVASRRAIATEKWPTRVVRMQRECLQTIESLEALWRSRFAILAYLRADMLWFPAVSLAALVAAARAPLLADGAARVLLPDSEMYHGLNDRLALLSRQAADVYFTRDDFCGPPGSYVNEFGGMRNMEGLLDRTLNASGVQVRLMPTLGSLGCCAAGRDACFLAKCKRGCYNGSEYQFKYEHEAELASANAWALASGHARLTHLGCAERWGKHQAPRCTPTIAEKHGCVRRPYALCFNPPRAANQSKALRWLRTGGQCLGGV